MDNKAFFKIPYGIYVVSAKDGDRQCGCITNTLMQISTAPSSVAISINKNNFTHDVVAKSKQFNISILNTSADFNLIKNFGFQSGRDNNKFDSNAKIASNDIAYIDNQANCYFSCNANKVVDFGTHSVFEGIVQDSVILNNLPTMTYDYYQASVKPKPQAQTSPTVFRCDICGFEYIGDTLPSDYICPLCKHGAVDFTKVAK